MRNAPDELASRRLSGFTLAGPVLAAAGVATLAASALGYRLGWWPVGRALTIAEWAVYAAALGLVTSAIGAVLARPGGKRRGLSFCLLGVAVSLPILAAAAQWEYATRAYPPINDVTTNTEDPPVFWDMPNPTEYPGGQTAALQRAAYPGLAPLVLNIAPDRVYALTKALVRDMNWEVIADDPKDGRIEAVASSRFYGFKDEIVVRIAASDGGARVDVRSRSRIGRIDRGVNAKRIRSFLAALKENAGKVKQ